MPCVQAGEARRRCMPGVDSLCSATAGHTITSPSSLGSAPSSAGETRGRPSGKASTSVGPASPMYCSCSRAHLASSTMVTDSSTSEATLHLDQHELRELEPARFVHGSSPTRCLPQPSRRPPRSVVSVVDVSVSESVSTPRRCRYEPVSHNVSRSELREVHVVDPLEDFAPPSARCASAGQVDLRDVAGDHHLRAETQPREKHLHLFRRGVLRLVQDDERVVEGASAHVCQWRDFDRPSVMSLGIVAGSIMSCSAS